MIPSQTVFTLNNKCEKNSLLQVTTMGNKNCSKRQNQTATDTKPNRRKSLSSRIKRSLSSSHILSKPKKQYCYSQVLKLIEEELTHYVHIDISNLILSFIPRSTIGDESVKIIPYVQTISLFIFYRIQSIRTMY